ncbi:MAG: type II toxin-antitoxin system RelE family toxin [Gammaproteobacteria bacterium]
MLLASQAERDLKRPAAQEFHRIILAIKALAETPRPPGCRKLVSSRDDYRIRIGDYRVIYEVDDKDNSWDAPNQAARWEGIGYKKYKPPFNALEPGLIRQGSGLRSRCR